MIVLVLLIHEILVRFLINSNILAFLPFLILFFFNHHRSFYLLFSLGSLINDLIFILPLGFTGVVLGAFFLFLIFLNKFFNLGKSKDIYFFSILILLLLLTSIFWYSKISLGSYFLYLFSINLFYLLIVLSLLRIFY